MTKVAWSVHISEVPELARPVGQVRASQRPLHVRDDEGDVALLVPVAHPTPRRLGRSPEAVVARLRATHGTVAPRQRPEDFRALREGFEKGVAEEAAREAR
jgi:hypothetical protein